MPTFECRVRTASNQPKVVHLEAPSLPVVLERLHREGYFVLSVKERSANLRQRSQGWLRWFQQVRLDELVGFSREFAVMIRAGVPLLETLHTLIEHMKPGALRTALEEVKREVEGGIPLSEAMGRRPQVFPDLYVSLVRSAEASGGLDEVLKRAADYLSESLALERRVKSALVYPGVVLTATMFVMAYIIAFIVPKFSEMFTQMAVELPLTTRLLVALGGFGEKNKLLVLASPLLIIGGVFGLWRIPKVRHRIGKMIARLPGIGDLTHKITLARTLSALQTLLATGVPLPRALELSAQTSGNLRMQEALHKVKLEVEGGIPLAHSMQETKMFPPLVIQLTAAGEKTGALPEMLGEAVAFYDDEVQQKLKGLTSIIEPMMMLFLGLVIGVFAFSVISPIYELMDKMK